MKTNESAKVTRGSDGYGISVVLNMTEIAVIAQRALAERIQGTKNGVWCGLFERLDRAIDSTPASYRMQGKRAG